MTSIRRDRYRQNALKPGARPACNDCDVLMVEAPREDDAFSNERGRTIV
jgi:hypothetical protein